jgi:hypothetical protein
MNSWREVSPPAGGAPSSRKNNMKFRAFAFAAATVMAAGLSGCVAVPDPDRHYIAQDNDAKLILRSNSINLPMRVRFSVSSNAAACKGFEQIGFVGDDGKAVLSPWVYKQVVSRNGPPPVELQAGVPGDGVIQVKGFGAWGFGSSCGPIAATFPAKKGDTYLVEFVWNGTTSCSMRVNDVTVPTETRSVAASYRYCRPAEWLGF